MKIIKLILWVYLFVGILCANTFEVASFEKKGKIISNNKQDTKNNYCALIKVKTNITEDIKFATGIPLQYPVEKKNSVEYWIYVSPDESVLNISINNYENVTIAIQGMGEINENDIIEIWLISPENDKKLMIPVTIISKPPNAEKWINEKFYGTGNDFIIPEGSHKLILKKNEYEDTQYDINVNMSNSNFIIPEMKRSDIVTFTIFTEPQGAKIYVDNKYEFDSNDGGFIYPGKHSLRIIKGGYQTINEVIDISNANNEFQYKLAQNVATVDFIVEPENAMISIDGILYNSGRIDFFPGNYKVSVQCDGYVTSELENLKLNAEEHIVKKIVLKKKVGNFTIKTTPLDALIYIDNIQMLSKENIELSVGPHNVILSKHGYNVVFDLINVEVDKQLSKEYILEAQFGKFQFNVNPIETNSSLESINGIYAQWRGLTYLSQIPIGSYILKSFYDEAKIKFTQNIVIQKDKTTIVNLSMKDRSKFYQILDSPIISFNDLEMLESRNFTEYENPPDTVENDLDAINFTFGGSLDLGYNYFGANCYNLISTLGFIGGIENQHNKIQYGVDVFYLSPYQPSTTSIIEEQSQTREYLNIAPRLSWKYSILKNHLYLGYEFAAGITYIPEEAGYSLYYKTPYMFLFPSIHAVFGQHEIGFIPYSENIEDVLATSWKLEYFYSINNVIKVYANTFITFDNTFSLNNATANIGTEISFAEINEEYKTFSEGTGIYIEPGLDYIIYSGGFWSQGITFSAYIAYFNKKYGRVGLSFSAGDIKTNAEFHYNYSAMLRYDVPVKIAGENYITPSLRVGYLVSSINNDLINSPIIAPGLYYERKLGEKTSIITGIYVPLDIISSLSMGSNVWIDRINFNLNFGVIL